VFYSASDSDKGAKYDEITYPVAQRTYVVLRASVIPQDFLEFRDMLHYLDKVPIDPAAGGDPIIAAASRARTSCRDEFLLWLLLPLSLGNVAHTVQVRF